MWEEGTWSGSRVTRFSVLLLVLLVAAQLGATRELGVAFDIGFVAICILMAMAVRPADFFRVGVLPPLLLFGLCCLLGLVWADSVAQADDGFVQAVVSGLAHRSAGLFIGYAVALLLLAVRHRMLGRRQREAQARPIPAQRAPAHSNLAGSPAPTRSTSGTPSERSTTVVGTDPHSPESITASTT